MTSLTERWTHQEIVDFLDICKEKRILTRMNSKRYRFDEILSDIRIDMENLGYSRTIHQMSLKFKKLRQRYRQCLPQDSTGKRMRRQFPFYKIMNEMEQDRQIQQGSDNDWELKEKIDVEFNCNVKSPHTQKSSEEIDSLKADPEMYHVDVIDGDSICPQPKNNPRNGKRAASNNYADCFKMLVTTFKSAQEDLQRSFFKQQLILQQQQQEWEEKILDEEREFFAKILNSSKSQQS